MITNTNHKLTIVKERIYAANGVLHFVSLQNGDPYQTAATDVRWLKQPGRELSLRLVARRGAKVSELVSEFNADFGTNGPYYYCGELLGHAIADGEKLAEARSKMTDWHGFAVANGRPVIEKLDSSRRYDLFVQGSPLLIENGKACWEECAARDQLPDEIAKSRLQRTAYGIDSAGDLHIAVADGRTKWDQGATLEEMALYLLGKGCTQAINLDGGNSSVIADSSGSLGQNRGSAEKAVNHAILIFLNEAAAALKSPAPSDPRAEALKWLEASGVIEPGRSAEEPIDLGALAQILQRWKQGGGMSS